MNQPEFKNGTGGLDGFDREGRDVSALLRSLPHVEAPQNFEFGVRAKIAQGAPPRKTFLPILKVTAPLGLLVAVGSFFFYDTTQIDNASRAVATPPVTQTTVPGIPATEAPKVSENGNPVVSVPASGALVAQQRRAVRTRTTSSSRSSRAVSIGLRPEGGSRDETLGTPKIIQPPGFEAANSAGANVNANVGGAPIPVRDVFEILGINADLSNGSWKVRSVTQNSLAARGKIQAGDVIEAVDGQRVTGSSVPKRTATTVTVRRDGKSINLNLKN